MKFGLFYFVAGLSPETVEWCGRQGYPFLSLLSIRQIQKVLPLYRQALREAGHDLDSRGVIPVRHTYVAESDAEAKRDVEEHYHEFWQLLLKTAVPVEGRALPRSYQFYSDFYARMAHLSCDVALKGHLGFFGSPDTVRKSLELHRKELDCRMVLCLMEFARLRHEQVLRSMKLWAEEVMPYFAEQRREER